MDDHRSWRFPLVAAGLLAFGLAGSAPALGQAVVPKASGSLAEWVEQLRENPDDAALRARVIRAAREPTNPPTIPEEARRYFIRGNTALEDAKGPEGLLRAVHHFKKALESAPWWGDAYRKLAQAREQRLDYAGAIDALGFYLQTGPAKGEARQVQDHIYVLEEKRDAAAEAANVAASPAPGTATPTVSAAAPAPAVPVPASVVSDAAPVVPSQPPSQPAMDLSRNGIQPVATTRTAGALFRDCEQCPEMLVVNAGLAMGRFLVTQQQWKDVMGSNPSLFRDCGDNCPVENISWNDAQEFVTRLSGQTGRRYAIPTEAQWESACMADAQVGSCGGQPFDAVAWTLRNGGARTHPVGLKQPNALGLYDMNGNVWEWTSDCSKDDCRYRVLRGGSWSFDPQFSGAKKRLGIDASRRLNDYGLRVVRLMP
jgi:formylglycine-generating enzyme required for sulfatase activity